MRKTCSQCNEIKDADQFHKRARHSTGLVPACKSCTKAASKRYYSKDPGKFRNSHLRWAFGIDQDQYKAKLTAQDGRCANPGCRTDKPGGSGKHFHVDHDHATGQVRALLCGSCNTALGLLREDHSRIRGLAQYLAPFKGAVQCS